LRDDRKPDLGVCARQLRPDSTDLIPDDLLDALTGLQLLVAGDPDSDPKGNPAVRAGSSGSPPPFLLLLGPQRLLLGRLPFDLPLRDETLDVLCKQPFAVPPAIRAGPGEEQGLLPLQPLARPR
jgi:hypothetical protein